MDKITPELIILGLNILFGLALLIGFLIGFGRGTYKATYRFVVSIVVILGCWYLFPLITNKLIEFDFSSVMTIPVQGYEASSIKDILLFATEAILGFIKNDGGAWTTYTGSVVIEETMLYGLMYGLLEMVLRVVMIISVLILNWTIFRIFFGVIYFIIRPKKKDENNKKIRKKMSSRLLGGVIGLVNTLAILLILTVPISGVISIADNAGTLIEDVNTDGILNMSLGTEVVQLSDTNLAEFKIGELKKWTSIYRKSMGGKIFSAKLSGTEMDYALFDKVFGFNVNGENISIREEINTCTNAIMVVKEELIVPLVNSQEMSPEILDKLSGEDIKAVFDELGKLKVVNVVVPIGLESGLYVVQNNEELQAQYADIVDIVDLVDAKNISISDMIVQVGDLSASLYDLALSTGYKPSELLNMGSNTSELLDKLLTLDSAKVQNVFNALGGFTIIDKLQDIAFVQAEDYLKNMEELQQFTLLLPKITVSEDGYYVIQDQKTTIVNNPDINISELKITLSENKNWVINDVETSINGENNLFEISLKDIKITDEIKNFGALYSAFKALGISSISGLETYIKSGPNATGSLDTANFTYENINGLFEAILGFKLLAKHTDNIYVVINNLGLPVDYRGLLKVEEIKPEDLTSLVMAAKVVADTGIIWDRDNLLYTDGKIDYTKLSTIFNKNKDALIDNIFSSSIITDNLSAVANSVLEYFLPDVTLNLEGIDWKTNGKEDLKNLCSVASTCLKYMDKLTGDISTLTEEEIDDICKSFSDNFSQSTLLKNNMNNILGAAKNIDALKQLGIVIEPLDDDEWTTDELKSIFDTLKVAAKIMAKDADGEDKNLLVEVLKLQEKDIDTLLKSKFIVKNIVANLITLTKENGVLYNKVVCNLTEEDPSWYDILDNEGNIIQKGEIRKILLNAVKLINGVEDFDDMDVVIETIITNISKLSNNINGTDDTVGEILSSNIISDTIIYHMQNLTTVLPDSVKDLIVVSDSIQWKDKDGIAGELRILFTAIQDLLIDEEGNVQYRKFKSGNVSDIVSILFNVTDAKIDNVLASKIILDTAVKIIIEYSEPDESRSFKIYLKNKDMNDQEWHSELSRIIKGAKLIAFDKEGNLISLNGSNDEYINLLTGVKDEDIDTIIASSILVDTIADIIISIADEEGAVIIVNDDYRTYDTDLWRSELSRIIKAGKAILVDSEGNSLYTKLMDGTTNDKLQILIDVNNEDYERLVSSSIITDTISHLIIEMTHEENAMITVGDDILAYTRAEWQEEIINIIKAAKCLLVRGEGENKEYLIEKLTNGNTQEMLEILTTIDTTITSGTLNAVETIVNSNVIIDTIVKVLKDLSGEENAIIYLSENVKAYTRAEWKTEIANMIYSAKALLTRINSGTEESLVSKLLSSNTEDILDLIIYLEDDEIGTVVSSSVIVDTIANILVDMSEEEGSVIVVSEAVKAYTTNEWRTEISKIISSAKSLLVKDGVSQSGKLLSGNENDLLMLIIDLGSDDAKITQVLSSEIFFDTVKKQVKDLGASVEGDSIITIPDDIDSWTRETWKTELKAIIKASEYIIVEEDSEGNRVVNLDKINGTADKLMLTISELTNEQVADVLESQILYLTLKTQVKALGSEEGTIIAMPADIDSWTKTEWTNEIIAVIDCINILFIEETDGVKTVNLNKLDGQDANQLLQTVADLTDNELDKVLNSHIILESISKQIIKLGEDKVENSIVTEKAIIVTSGVTSYTHAQWKEEIKNIIKACKTLLTDEVTGKINIDLLSGSNDAILELICGLTTEETSTTSSDVKIILSSQIIYDTMVKTIKELAQDSNDNGVITKSVIKLPEGIDDWNKITWEDELKAIINSVNLLLVDDEGNIDSSALNSGDFNKILGLIVDLTDSEVTTVLSSNIIYTTIVEQIIELADDSENANVITLNSSIYNKTSLKSVWENEIKRMIKAVKTLLCEPDGTVNINKITSSSTNELLQLIVDLSSEDLEKVLASDILVDTISDKILEYGIGDDATLVISIKVKAYTTESWRQEINAIITSAKLILLDSEGHVDINNISSNTDTLLNNVVSLNSNFNKVNDDLGTVLSSAIISDTIIDMIQKESSEQGGMLMIPSDIVWKDTTEKGELRHLFESIKVLFGLEQITMAKLTDTNQLLSRVKNLNNDPNGVNDQVGTFLGSRILSETIIKFIKDEDVNAAVPGKIVVNYPVTDSKWYDEKVAGVIINEGELRKIFASIPVIFGDTVDIKSISANTILDLSDSDVDTILKSQVFNDTIRKYIMDLNGNSGIVVNEITNLNDEVKALIVAAKIILADEHGVVDLDNPNFDVEKILNLTELDQNKILSSQIIIDTIKAKMIELGDDESDVLVVLENHITDWKEEIKSIISSAKLVLKVDTNGKYLSNPTVDYSKIYNLTEQNITTLLKSQIITDTIIMALVDTDALQTTSIINSIKASIPGYDGLSDKEKNNVITSASIWKDIYTGTELTQKGEVHKLLTAATKLIDNEDVDINRLKTITDDDLELVFASQIMLDTFYYEIDKLSSGADPVLFIKNGMVKDALEAKNFVRSIKVVVGDQDITNMNSTEFNFDKFISKTDAEIAILLSSQIISYSAAKKVLPILCEDSLGNPGQLQAYVTIDGTTENEKLDTIAADLGNLLKVMRDLNSDPIGIKYDTFSFDKFMTVISDATDKNAMADQIADTLLMSNIIKKSLTKMMTTILEGSLDSSMMACVNLNMDDPAAPNDSYWLDYDANGNSIIEDSEIGEFKKIFRMLTFIDQFTNENSADNSHITDKDSIALPLKAINNSRVLHGIIPNFVETALANVSTWKYQATDPLYRETLTVAEWDTEIDSISEIVALVNNEDAFTNLSNIDVKSGDLSTDSLATLLRAIACSRILDIANIEEFVQTAVNTTLLTDVTVTPVYTGSNYNEKVTKWNDLTTGEVTKLMNAVDTLRQIEDIDITDDTNIGGTYTYLGVKYAHEIGTFMNSCKESVMLSSIIGDVFYKFTSVRVPEEEIQSTDFDTRLMEVSNALIFASHLGL